MPICFATNIASTPVVYEVGGRLGELWAKEFKRLLGMHPEGGHHSYRQYWVSLFSITLQTRIATAFLTRKANFLDKSNKRQGGGFFSTDTQTMLDSSYINVGGFDSSLNE